MSIGHLDVAKFESENQNLELIEKFGTGEREISVYFNKDDGSYYCKGAFARWETVCYIHLGTITGPEGIQAWISQMKTLNRL